MKWRRSKWNLFMFSLIGQWFNKFLKILFFNLTNHRLLVHQIQQDNGQDNCHNRSLASSISVPETDGIAKVEYRHVPYTASAYIVPNRTVRLIVLVFQGCYHLFCFNTYDVPITLTKIRAGSLFFNQIRSSFFLSKGREWIEVLFIDQQIIDGSGIGKIFLII